MERYKREGLYNPISSWQLPHFGNDSTVLQYMDPNDGGYVLFCILFILLGSSGIFLNWRAFYSFFRIHTVKNRINFIVLNIVFSDFLISSIGIFLDIVGMLQTIGSSLRGKTLESFTCQFEGLFYMAVGMSSLFSTLTFSVVRLMIIKRKNNVWLQNCEFSFKETRALQIIWLLSLSFSLPPFFGFGRYGKDVIGVSCLPTWSSRNPYELGFIWYVCIAGGVIPAILMITINLYVIFTLNNKRSNAQYSITVTTQQPLLEQYRQRENLVMVLAFLICWAPFGVMYLLPLTGIQDRKSFEITDVFPLLSAKLGCCIINPLVYSFENLEFHANRVSNISDFCSKQNLLYLKPVAIKKRNSI